MEFVQSCDLITALSLTCVYRNARNTCSKLMCSQERIWLHVLKSD